MEAVNHSEEISAKARRIQDVVNRFGWNVDIDAFMHRVQQWDNGLTQEDEFSYLLTWSTQCINAHKLDQFYIQPSGKNKYTIPDLFVLLNSADGPKPFYIEIKTSTKNISWTDKYYNGLVNYSNITGIPVLVAWKMKPFDVWALFELRHFTKSTSNYKIDLNTAHRESLMSKLLGDYFIKSYEEIGLHFKFKKVAINKQEGNTIEWNAITESVYITGNGGKEVHEINKSILLYIVSFPFKEITTETDTHIIYSFIPEPNKSAFAQSVITRFVRAYTDGDINWLELIKNQNFPISYENLLDSLTKGIEQEIIRNILFLSPNSEKE